MKTKFSRKNCKTIILIHLKIKAHIASELRPREVYIQHPRSSTQRGIFYQGQNRTGLTPKEDNTS